MAIAKVEPLTTARALRGPFDYRLPERLGDVDVGTVLLVPFGHRRVIGVVVELAERSALPPERLAEPIKALEAGAPPELVRLGLWVAREYCSTPARGLDLVLPPGTASARGQGAARTELLAAATSDAAAALAGEGGALGPVQRRALGLLTEAATPVAATQLAARRRRARCAQAARAARPRRAQPSRGPAAPAQRRDRRPARPVELDAAQRAAATRIVAALDDGGAELLLHGVTGSGKTEVYLAAAAAALERGRGVIVLVPEIGMTPQAVARFRRRFGDRVAVLHSRLGVGERRDEWHRLRSGAATICVGPRSAVFAPVADLGLIVVDEEHDPSYKQEGDPRYDAREVARRRAAEAGAAIVSGSATPRPESWRELERIELPSRVDGRPLPAVEVVDMRERSGTAGPLHRRTREALAALRETGGKAIVLVNRRGWSAHLSCRSCGRAWSCPDCDVSMVVHRGAGELRCHHCGGGRAASLELSRLRLGDPRARRRRQRADRVGAGRASWPRSRCSGSTPTRRPAATATSRSSPAFKPPSRACSWARRWWPRATTSPTSCSAWWSMPTRVCGSPTSGPRSGPSRWSRSSPGAAAAESGRAG